MDEKVCFTTVRMAVVARRQSDTTASQAIDDDRNCEDAGATWHKYAQTLSQRQLRIAYVLERIRMHDEVESVTWK